MRTETPEHFCLHDFVMHTMSDAGRIIENQHFRYTADELKDVFKSLAHTFCGFTAEQLGDAIVAVRK